MSKLTLFALLSICIGLALGAASPPQPLDMLAKAITKCTSLYPVELDERSKFRTRNFPDDADRLAKCYIHCLAERTKTTDESGKLDPVVIHGVMTALLQSNLKMDPMDAINECIKNRRETNKCSKSYATVKCIAGKKIWLA